MRTIAPNSDADAARSADPLAQLARLIPHLNDEDLDLDAIDGEFYWRCCNPKFSPGLERPPDDRGGWLRLRDGMTRLLDGPELTEAGLAFLNRVWESMDDDWNVTHDVGAAPSEMYIQRPGSTPRVEVRVFSNRWTGAEVEKRIASSLSEEQWLRRLGDSLEPRPGTPIESIGVRAAFAPAGTEVTDWAPRLGVLRITQPHILVTVDLPLPPTGTVARLYDAILAGNPEWRERLVGVANRQEKRVALRTWAIGLLLRAGHKTHYAIGNACEVLGEDGISQPQFNGDRLRLLERVPEAQSFLLVKPSRRRPQRDK